MTSIHPHWDSTDDASEQRVRISASPKDRDISMPIAGAQSIPRASRRPAALVGIGLFFVMGAAMFNGYVHINSFRADVAGTATAVISATGVAPQSLTIQPGTTITWTNNDTIPHILSADTLIMGDGKGLLTSPIFPGSTTHVLIPATTKPGTYTYISKTSQKLSGAIVVSGAPVTNGSNAANGTSAASAATATTIIPPPPIAAQSASSVRSFEPLPVTITAVAPSSTPSIPENGLTAQVTLPENPHMVGTQSDTMRMDPYSDQTVPAITTIKTKPKRETSTGPTAWVAVLLSVGGFLFVIRKQLRTI